MFHAQIFIHRHVEAAPFSTRIYACVYNHDPRRCHAAVIFRRTVDVVLKLARTTVVFCSNVIICHGVSRKSGTSMAVVAVVAVAVPTPLLIIALQMKRRRRRRRNRRLWTREWILQCERLCDRERGDVRRPRMAAIINYTRVFAKCDVTKLCCL